MLSKRRKRVRILIHLLAAFLYTACIAAVFIYVQPVLPVFPDSSYFYAVAAFSCALILHFISLQFIYMRGVARRQRALEKDLLQILRKVDDYDARLAEFDHAATQGFAQTTAELMDEIRHLQRLILNRADVKTASESNIGTFDQGLVSDPQIDDVLQVVKNAISENRLDLHVQPVVGLPNRRAKFYECFVRVRDEDGRVIFPIAFMEDAQATGLSTALDNLILFKCVQMIRQLGPRQPKVRFFYNISVASMLENSFQTQFVEFLTLNKELASRLIFEFDFEEFQENLDALKPALQQLADSGYQFSLEKLDLSDLAPNVLETLNIRFVKVTAKNLLEEKEGVDIHLSDLTALLERSEISLVATHVEAETDAIALIEHGLKFGQGYLFGAPKEAKLMKSGAAANEPSRVA